MHDVFASLDSKDESLSEIFKAYKNFRGEVGQNKANCSLDFEQYDTDEQAFLCSLNDMSDKQSEFISVCNMVIDRYNMLVEEVDKTLVGWAKCNEMLEMIKLMAARPYDISMICLN